eukprot:5343085-Pleurochrysis_carterae.AAC.1
MAHRRHKLHLGCAFESAVAPTHPCAQHTRKFSSSDVLAAKQSPGETISVPCPERWPSCEEEIQLAVDGRDGAEVLLPQRQEDGVEDAVGEA